MDNLNFFVGAIQLGVYDGSVNWFDLAVRARDFDKRMGDLIEATAEPDASA